MQDQEIESRLSLLKVRAPSIDLRSEILRRIDLESRPERIRKSWLRSQREMIAAACFLLASISFWFLSSSMQQDRLARLLGPSVEERRVEFALQVLGPIESPSGREALRLQLQKQFETLSRVEKTSPLISLTSEIVTRLETKAHDTSHSPLPSLPRGGTRYHRRVDRMEKLHKA